MAPMLQAWRALSLLAPGALAAQSPTPAALDAVLQQAEAQRAAYVATFRNVTATETRVTELFDERGRVNKQRTLVSHFLVYQSRFDPAVLSEYRIPLTVDGKADRQAGAGRDQAVRQTGEGPLHGGGAGGSERAEREPRTPGRCGGA